MYNGSFIKALMHTFPDIGIHESKFTTVPSMLQLHYNSFPQTNIITMPLENFWLDSSNHRLFLEDFANQMGFDPLIPEYWYSISKHDILAAKVRIHQIDVIFDYTNYSISLSMEGPCWRDILWSGKGLLQRYFRILGSINLSSCFYPVCIFLIQSSLFLFSVHEIIR